MPLDTAEVKRRLAAAPSNQDDNEAQNIINGASTTELTNLEAEGVLRLYRALTTGWYSSRDMAAAERLKTNTQFQAVTNTPEYGVDLVRNAAKTKNQRLITADLVKNIYAAEYKRLSIWERIGIDGATIGRGQLGQPAYIDVKTKFADELQTCANRVFIDIQFKITPHPSMHVDYSTFSVIVPAKYSEVVNFTAIEDFVVAAYLAIRVDAATKAGRSNDDTLKFAVALYHGMRGMVVDAQTAVGDDINWAPVEAHLRSNGHTDEADYVNEVVK